MRLTVSIEGINLEKLLRAAQEEGIVLFGARRMDARAMLITIAPGSRKALEALCEKSGWQMRELRADSLLRAVRLFGRRCGLVCALLLWAMLLPMSCAGCCLLFRRKKAEEQH